MNNNIQKFTFLRDNYKNFYFEAVESILSDFYIELKYHYSFDKKIDFRHVLRIKKNSDLKNIIDLEKYKKIILALGIIEGINYYKAVSPENFIVECDELTEDEKRWWEKLFYKGLGEYRYLNGINIDESEFVHFASTGSKIDKVEVSDLKGNLVLVGGGKDSITSLEILNDEKDYNKILIVNPRTASYESAKTAGYNDEDIIVVERIIDENLLALNDEGFLNGHIPFSAMLAFLSTLISAMTGRKNVVVSNEDSANEDTVEGANHQYSKTLEFENDFRSYSHNSLFSSEEVNYYSILRPLSELQIVKIFVNYKKYFNVFKSCNVGSKIIDKREVWCGCCPKCLFVYILLLSQLDSSEVINIIGNDMLDNIKMKEDFEKLIGVRDEKPFECIGTKDEVNAAMSLILEKDEYKNNENLPLLIKYYKDECQNKHMNKDQIDKILNSYETNNNVTRETTEKIKKLLGIL
ncbi:MAG: hypothetical protein MJ232_01200 [archaeon]|nr:hypothetical protein [archaeon]